MAIFLFSTNMKLKKLVEDATSWWAEWEYNFERIDTHDHSPNKGKQLAGASLTANDDYYFGSVTINQDPNKNFILLGKKSADPNPAIPTDRGYLYTKDDGAGNTNLFYYDEARNVIQLTREGSIVSGPLRIFDIPKAYELLVTWNETGTADRTLNFKVNNGSRTIDLSGDLTVTAASTINQDVRDSASPTFSSLFVSDAGTKKLELDSADAANAANRKLSFKVNDADRTIDLSANITVTGTSTINQNVSTTAKPAFSGMELSEMAAPSTPTNAGILYVTTGNDLHYVKEDGTDVVVTLGGGVGGSIADATTAFLLTMKSDSTPDFTANRDLTFNLVNASRTLTISGDASVDQDVRIASSPVFVTPSLTSLKLKDSALDNTLEIKSNEDLAADRILNLIVGAANRTITLGGDLSVGASSNINQDVQTTAAPSFAGITLTASTAALTWALKDNDASALSIGSAGAADMMKFVTLDAAEEVVFADDKARSSTNAAPSNAKSFTNKKYVDDQIALHDTFLELTDTPAAYVTPDAIYRVNAAGTAVEESLVILTEPGANNFTLTKGTSALDVQADLTITGDSYINQDVRNSASPTFVKPHFTSGLELEDPGVGTNKITFQAPTLAGDYTLTWPTTDGAPGEVLGTDGSGVLSWGAAPAPSIPDGITGFNLAFASASVPGFSAGRLLTFDLANASRTLTVDGTSAINQDVRTSSSPTFITPSVTTIKLLDSGADNTLELKDNENNAGNRILNLKVNNADRTIDLSNNLTVESATSVILNQDLTTDADVTFNSIIQSDTQLLDNNIYLVSGDFPNTTTLYGWHINAGSDAATISNWIGGQDLTRTGALTQQPDHLGNNVYCEFDGTNDYLSSTDAVFNFTGSFSLEIWAYKTDWSTWASSQTLISRHNGTNGWIFYVNSATKSLNFQVGADSPPNVDISKLSAGFHNFIVTRTAAGNTQIYVDRKWVATWVSAAITAAGNLEIGSYNGGTLKWNGRLSEVIIHNATAWTENEESKVYSRGARRLAALDQNGSIQIPQNETIFYPPRTGLTITPASGTWTDYGSIYTPYIDVLGKWRLKFNIVGLLGTGSSAPQITITGVTFANKTNFYQAVVAIDLINPSTTNLRSAYTIPNAGTIAMNFGASVTHIGISGDVELNAKPTI